MQLRSKVCEHSLTVIPMQVGKVLNVVKFFQLAFNISSVICGFI